MCTSWYLRIGDDLRRWLAFRWKVRAAGLRIMRKDWWPIETIQVPRPRDPPWPTVFATPHYHLLACENGVPLRATAYWDWQLSLRGTDHLRPDEWIEAMAMRLKRLHKDIRDNGYRLRSVTDRIAVREDGMLWDGGHRLACLAAEGWVLVPVVVVRERGENAEL